MAGDFNITEYAKDAYSDTRGFHGGTCQIEKEAFDFLKETGGLYLVEQLMHTYKGTVGDACTSLLDRADSNVHLGDQQTLAQFCYLRPAPVTNSGTSMVTPPLDLA